MLGRRTACVWTAVAPPGTRGLSRFLAAKKKQRNRVDESMVAEQMAKLQTKAKAQAASQTYLGSLGRVADAYLPGVTPGIGKRAKNELTNRMALGKIQKDLGPKFKTADLETIATDLYVAYQKAFASADMNAVRDLVAPHVFTKVKDTFPEHKPGTRYEWSGVVSSSRVQTIRFIPVDEVALNFAQVCVRLGTRQSLSLVDVKTATVIKSTTEREIIENWVLERITNKKEEKWRWCGSLPLPEGELSLLEMQEGMKQQQ